jgi:hypothetical protein
MLIISRIECRKDDSFSFCISSVEMGKPNRSSTNSLEEKHNSNQIIALIINKTYKYTNEHMINHVIGIVFIETREGRESYSTQVYMN